MFKLMHLLCTNQPNLSLINTLFWALYELYTQAKIVFKEKSILNADILSLNAQALEMLQLLRFVVKCKQTGLCLLNAL